MRLLQPKQPPKLQILVFRLNELKTLKAQTKPTKTKHFMSHRHAQPLEVSLDFRWPWGIPLSKLSQAASLAKKSLVEIPAYKRFYRLINDSFGLACTPQSRFGYQEVQLPAETNKLSSYANALRSSKAVAGWHSPRLPCSGKRDFINDQEIWKRLYFSLCYKTFQVIS